MTTWNLRLRAERKRLGLTRPALGALLGVPVETLRRWEDGTRRPPEERLRGVLDAMKVVGATANDILRDAGYQPQPTLFPNWQYPNYFFVADELPAAVERVPWPEFVLDNNVQVIAANTATQALWRIDFEKERATRTRAQMSLLSVASDHHFADRLMNWDECIAEIAAVFKGQPARPETLDAPSTYFNGVLAEFAAGDPAFLARFVQIFAETPPMEAKVRGTYPVVWEDPEFGIMRFLALRNTASEPDGYGFQDWIPTDAASWTVLEAVKARHNAIR